MVLHVLKEKAQKGHFGAFAQEVIREAEGYALAPDRLIVRPDDPWPGCTERAQKILAHPSLKDPQYWPDAWHDFQFLRDIRHFGGKQACKIGAEMIAAWIDTVLVGKKNQDEHCLRPDVLGKRISAWISHYDYFIADTDHDIHDAFFDSLSEQAGYLRNFVQNPPRDLYGLHALQAVKGYLFHAMAAEGQEHHIQVGIDRLVAELKTQIQEDGTHISRSPWRLLKTLQICLDIRTCLLGAAYPLPPSLADTIENMAKTLKTMRGQDGALFAIQGSGESDSALITMVIDQAASGQSPRRRFKDAGFEKIMQGRTAILFDCGKAPPAPYDRYAHAAPLSFEMHYGRERLFVSCGSSFSDPNWAESLRATSAHNTLIIDNVNAYEIHEGGGIRRRAKNTICKREEDKKTCFIEASHDGYHKLNGITHTRRLFLSAQGGDLKGEDHLSCKRGLSQMKIGAIRFHLHPRALVSLVKQGEEALVRLPSGIGWRFTHEGGVLKLEDSVYVAEDDTPRKTKQLVIYGRMENSEALIKWALQREGIPRDNYGESEDSDGETPDLLSL